MKLNVILTCGIFALYTSLSVAVTPVRLVDGPHRYAGRLEVYYKGEWGSVCGGFDQDNADVVCGMIRNSTIGLVNATIQQNSYYGHSTGPIMIKNLRCNGTEDDLFFCKSDEWKSSQSCYYYYQNVGIDCNTQVRLRDNRYGMGRVQILHNGAWGYVCNTNFHREEAEVICKTMGLSSRNVSYGSYGYGSSYNYKNVVDCFGDEEDLSQCHIYDGYCSESRDVMVDCGDTNIQLINGPNELHGQLQVEYHGSWLNFCDEGFGPNEARVACKMINNGTNVTGTITRRYFGNHYFNQVKNLRCSGNEDDISQCLSGSWGYSRCSSSYIVHLDCNTVRLVDGRNNYYGNEAGRLEVYTDGNWQSICANNFNSYDAKVICKMLGYYGYSRVSNNRYPEGHGDVTPQLVLRCHGYENDISECPSYKSYSHCNSWYKAEVECYNDTDYYTRSYWFLHSTIQSESSLRLVNGNGHSGRVEVYFQNQWGTICDSNFDHDDVKAVCRSLGFYRGSNYGIAYYGAHFGEGDGNVVIEDLQCQGHETHLSQCASKTWLSNGCDHSRDVGVDCYAYRYDHYTTQGSNVMRSSGNYEGAIRLVNGYNSYSGRVEIFYNGQWGTICDDDFDRNDARVVCRVLGIDYGYERVYTNAHFGSGNGPITIDDLRCNGNEWGLSQCSSRPWYSNDCSHSEDVGVNCYYTITSTTTTPWWYTKDTNTRITSPAPTMDDIIDVNCDESGWNIRVNMNLLRHLYPNAKASDIYLGENSCTGSQNWYSVTFNQGLRECLTSETIRNNVLVYSNELVYAERDPNYNFIIRHYNWTVGIECDVQRNESSSAHIHHDSNHLMKPQVTGSSHFAVNMSFYSDPNFMRQIYGYPLHVSVGDKVYVKVFTTTPDWSVKMRVHTCYTKPSQYAADYMKFFLIRNGCEVDSNTHLISQSAHETKLVFEDFEYASNHEGIDVFCDAVFCSSHDYSRQCQQTCNPVIRRKINVEKVEDVTAANTDVGNVDSTVANEEEGNWETTMANKEMINEDVTMANENTSSDKATPES